MGAVLSGWIKVEKDLKDDPRVIRMSRALCNADVTLQRFSSNALVTLALGGLTQLWFYADTHIRDDDVLDLGIDDIDEIVGIKGFCQILPSDWLQVLDTNHVKLPGFHAHNGTQAKKKALTQKRVEKHRESVTHKSVSKKRTSVTNALPDQTRPDLDQTETQEEPTMVAARPLRPDPPEFLRFKATYPYRAGSQPWPRALQAITARLREGHSWAEILDGATRYAEFCLATGKVGTEHVQQAARFCGPGKEFLQPWTLPSTKADVRLAGNLSAADEFMRRTEARR